jgi:hemerythrin
MNSKTLWDSKLSIGSEVIDNQHRVLFDLIKDLNNATAAGASMKVLDTLLGVLRNYSFQHFEIEEKYFKDHADFTKHCMEHYQLIKKLNSFIIDFRNNRYEGKKTPSTFLEHWLLDHIERFDKPFLIHNAACLELMKDSGPVDEFEPEPMNKRQNKRIPHYEVVDGNIDVSCYNAIRLKVGKATVVDMSVGGLLLNSDDHHGIGDLLVVSCSIGANFNMKEKVQVKTVNGNMYGVEFVSPSAETVNFFTKLYGAVHLRQTRVS